MANEIIKLSPEELMSQSMQLTSLMSEFENFFSGLKSQLNDLNGEWSEAISHNFNGKLQSVQVGCSGIVDMIRNGANAAKLSSLTFGEGGSVGDILGDLLKYGESQAFKQIDDIIKSIGKADDATLVEKLLSGGYSTETIKSVLKDAKDGNYESVLKTLYETGKGLVSGAMSIGESSDWVNTLNQMTGGKLGLTNLAKDYYENWIFGTIERGANIVMNSENGTYDSNPKQGLVDVADFAWNFGPGAVLDTTGDVIYNVVSKIPGVSDFYAERGATDAGSMASVAYGELVYTITGDREAADYYQNYYKDHGGIAGGLVDGIMDTIDFVGEKMGANNFITKIAHNYLYEN